MVLRVFKGYGSELVRGLLGNFLTFGKVIKIWNFILLILNSSKIQLAIGVKINLVGKDGISIIHHLKDLVVVLI